MKVFITYQPLEVSTVNGYAIQIVKTFSTFDAEDFEALKIWCEENIHAGIEVKVDDSNITI